MKIEFQFQELFSCGDEGEMLPAAENGEANVPNPFDKFFADAESGALLNLGAYGPQHVAALHEESAPRDRAIEAHYKKIADAASKPAAGDARLEKSEAAYLLGDGTRLGKSEITSRMLALLTKMRPFCIGDEEKQIEKAIRCLDFTLFGELGEPVMERMRILAART